MWIVKSQSVDCSGQRRQNCSSPLSHGGGELRMAVSLEKVLTKSKKAERNGAYQ